MEDKQKLLDKRNSLKFRMDLRRLFIKSERDIINTCLKSIEANKKEYKQFQKEYMELLDEL